MTNPSTATIIHRPFGGLTGYRVAYDRASRAVVHAFPIADLAAVSAAGLLRGAGAYILTDGMTAYVGESNRPSRRLVEHASNSSKSFAREAFVVGGCEGSAFDKATALDFQYRLTMAAIDAGIVRVAKGVNPIQPDLQAADRSTHDRIYGDALRLLHDAGCNILHSTARAPADQADRGCGTSEESISTGTVGGDDDQASSVPISTFTSEAGPEQFELRFMGLWARGHWEGRRFVVAPGSELRVQRNDSVDQATRDRHQDLIASVLVAPIPGLSDRLRIVAPVPFGSDSIAAKVLCGAHSAGRWLSLGSPKLAWSAA